MSCSTNATHTSARTLSPLYDQLRRRLYKAQGVRSGAQLLRYCASQEELLDAAIRTLRRYQEMSAALESTLELGFSRLSLDQKLLGTAPPMYSGPTRSSSSSRSTKTTVNLNPYHDEQVGGGGATGSEASLRLTPSKSMSSISRCSSLSGMLSTSLSTRLSRRSTSSSSSARSSSPASASFMISPTHSTQPPVPLARASSMTSLSTPVSNAIIISTLNNRTSFQQQTPMLSVSQPDSVIPFALAPLRASADHIYSHRSSSSCSSSRAIVSREASMDTFFRELLHRSAIPWAILGPDLRFLDANDCFLRLPFAPRPAYNSTKHGRSAGINRFMGASRYPDLMDTHQLPKLALGLLEAKRGAVVLHEALMVSISPVHTTAREDLVHLQSSRYTQISEHSDLHRGGGSLVFSAADSLPDDVSQTNSRSAALQVRIVIFAAPSSADAENSDSFVFEVTECESFEMPMAPRATADQFAARSTELPFFILHHMNSVLSPPIS